MESRGDGGECFKCQLGWVNAKEMPVGWWEYWGKCGTRLEGVQESSSGMDDSWGTAGRGDYSEAAGRWDHSGAVGLRDCINRKRMRDLAGSAKCQHTKKTRGHDARGQEVGMPRCQDQRTISRILQRK